MNLPGGWELVLVVLVIMVLFGAKRLPDASRSLGRSLRIFKAETKGLVDDDDDDRTKTEEQRSIDAQRSSEPATHVETAEVVEEQRRPDTGR